MIEVKNLSKHFGQVKAVDDVSFKVGDGEIVGFLGPNGAGKTTTMKVLTCFYSPTAGGARVNGLDVVNDSVAVRAGIGYLPENNPLYNEMGVMEYLYFLADVHKLKPSKKRTRIDEIIGLTSLGEMVHKDISELSRGFRQRVGLAQALIHDPPVLILDEPTSGLDPIQIQEIRSLIRDVGREKTVLFSTHILPEAQSLSDRILIISDGKIVGEGTPDELTAMAAGEAITHVRIKGNAGMARALLDKVTENAKVEEISDDSEVAGFRISSSGEEDLAEHIFDAVVGAGMKLVEIYQERASLEDVFNRLARRSDNGGDGTDERSGGA